MAKRRQATISQGGHMPLRDRFQRPVENQAWWEEVHGLWPGIIAMRWNATIPPQYRCGVKIHLGTVVEVNVEYEVRVYDSKRAQRLVAAIELVSPSNK